MRKRGSPIGEPLFGVPGVGLVAREDELEDRANRRRVDDRTYLHDFVGPFVAVEDQARVDGNEDVRTVAAIFLTRAGVG